MKLNKLSYQIIEGDEGDHLEGLWFELLIDGEQIDFLVEKDERAIPYDYFDENEIDLPSYFNDFFKKSVYTLGVCSCGFGGCGETRCFVEKNSEIVSLKSIPSGILELEDFDFNFLRENYDEVMKEIVEKANRYKNNFKQLNKQEKI